MTDNRLDYYSENWHDATDKFVKVATRFGDVKWCKHPHNEFNIPYISIGNGKKQVVINSGVHGIEGYFGSAAQIMFLNEFMQTISESALNNYTITLIHVINGWGMQNRMREVFDKHTDGLVDLNRNFGIDFSKPELLPKNEKYKLIHDLLVNTPGGRDKLQKILDFYRANKSNGVWDSPKDGQYYEPFGLFYGGNRATAESEMTMQIYDDIMSNDAGTLISVGLHSGLGDFDRAHATTTGSLLVSHPHNHPNTKKFIEISNGCLHITCDNDAIDGPTLQGDLVDCLERRYKTDKRDVYTADFEIGTGEYPNLSTILKRMDMGDARYDLMHSGKINDETFQHLTESWYPSDNGWKLSALKHASRLFTSLIKYMEK